MLHLGAAALRTGLRFLALGVAAHHLEEVLALTALELIHRHGSVSSRASFPASPSLVELTRRKPVELVEGWKSRPLLTDSAKSRTLDGQRHSVRLGGHWSSAYRRYQTPAA